MVTETINLALQLQNDRYITSLVEAQNAGVGFARSTQQIGSAVGIAQKALAVFTPKFLTGGLTAAVGAAASYESQLEGLQATAKVTGQDMGQLDSSVKSIARSFPVGTAGAVSMVKALQGAGISAAGQEKKLESLSKTSIQLGAATGTSAEQVGTGLVRLSRSFGDFDVNPKRFKDMADTVTELSAKTGASATGILNFSQSIAPFARSAGLGQKAVLGISASFTRLGEDGFAASNIVSKIFGDMNKSIRDGSPELAAYADIAGKTKEEFTALAKVNPAEALAQVTEAISAAGPAEGSRMLERIGVEGVRGQRAISALTQSGGVRGVLGIAQGARGGNATEEASKEAFNGLNDSLTKLQSSMGQLGAAIGAPVLGPLGAFVDSVGKATSTLAALAASPAGKAVGKAVGAAGATAAVAASPLLLGAAVVGGMRALSTVRQVAGNNFLNTATQVGRKQARGIPLNDRQQKFADRMAYTRANPDAPDSDKKSIRQNQRTASERAYRAGQGYGEARGPAASPGTPFRTRIVQGASVMQQGYRGVSRGLDDSTRQLRDDPGRRTSMLSPARNSKGQATGMYGRFADNARGRGGVPGAAETDTALRRLGTSFRILGRDMAGNGSATRVAASGVRTYTASLLLNARAATGAAGAVAGAGIAKVAGSALGLVGGGIGLAAVGGLVAYSQYKKVQGEKKEDMEDFNSTKSSSFFDTMAESLNKAGNSTDTFATAAERAAQQLNKNFGGQGNPEVTAADIAAADADPEVVTKLFGSKSNIAAQLEAQYAGQPVDSEIRQGVKVDLLRQRESLGLTLEDVQELTKGVTGERGSVDMQQLLGSVAGSKRGGLNLGNQASDDYRTIIKQVAGTIETTQLDNQKYGPEYAKEIAQQSAEDAVEIAISQGNYAGAAELANKLASSVFGNKDAGIDRQDAELYGAYGSLSGRTFLADQLDIDPTTVRVRPAMQESATAKAFESTPKIAEAFSQLGGSFVNRAVQEARTSIGDPGAQQAASNAFVNAYAGNSDDTAQALADVATALNNLADPDTNPDAPILSTIQGGLQQRLQLQQAAQDPAVAYRQTYQANAANAVRRSSSPLVQSGINDSIQAIKDSQEQAKQVLGQRLQAEIGFQNQMTRGARDYNLQMKYTEADFATGMSRQRQSYNLSRSRSEASYQLGVKRSEQQFNLGRARGEEDFARGQKQTQEDYFLSIRYAQEDYQTSVLRAQRDFNKQMKRMNEDAAKSMYDPYKRIQVQAVYDLGTLAQNLREQNDALVSQARNLAEFRKLGGSNQAIDQLGLNKSENAQQLQTLVANAQSQGPAALEELNRLVAERMRAAATLATDESNVDVKRAQEDFASSLRDQEQDYLKSMDRQDQEFAKQNARARAEFGLTMLRQAADYQTATQQGAQDFELSMRNMAEDFKISMDQAGADQAKSIARMKQAYTTSVSDARIDFANSQKVITGDIEQIQRALTDAMSGNITSGTALLGDTASKLLGEVKKVWAGIDPELRRLIGADPSVIPTLAYFGDPKNSPYGDDRRTPMGDNSDPGPDKGKGYAPIGSPMSYNTMRDSLQKGTVLPVEVTSSFRPGAVTAGTGRKSYHASGRALDLKPSVALFNNIALRYPQSKELIYSPMNSRQINNGKPYSYPNPKTRADHFDHIHWAMAKGGVATQPTKVVIGEARDNEAIIPLNAGGMNMLGETMARYLGTETAANSSTSSARTHITYSTTHITHDSRTEISGPIQVVSNDPLEMARMLQEKARRDSLGRTPTSKGS